jgi:hypothetical protein
MKDDAEGNEIQFASSEYVEASHDFAYNLVKDVFQVDAAFISDESTLHDFLCSAERDAFIERVAKPTDIWSIEQAHARIEEYYGINVRPELRIWRIAEKIHRAH